MKEGKYVCQGIYMAKSAMVEDGPQRGKWSR